jgi:beta-galactosidase
VTIDLRRVADPRFFAEHRMPAHSDHRWFRDAAEAASGTSSFEQLLNGTWRFHYAESPADTVPGFEAADVDVSGWDDIPVPTHIQLQGYDRPQYVNVQYPWDGNEQVEPGEIPTRFNPVGSYLRTFTLDAPLAAGERVSVVFEGAESAIAVWCNGRYVGYATDSFTPSEFDLTELLVPARTGSRRRCSSGAPRRGSRGRTCSASRGCSGMSCCTAARSRTPKTCA